MKRIPLLVTCSAIVLGAAALLQLRAQTGGMAGMPGMAGGAVKLDTAKIESLTGLKGTSGGKGEVVGADIDPAKTTLDPKKIDAILSAPGALASGVYKVTIGRTTKMDGVTVGNTMGVNTWAAFVGSDDKAAVMGDF